MYPNFHSSVGLIISTLPLPLYLKIPLAFYSHHFSDMLDKHHEKSFHDIMMKIQISVHIVFMAIVICSYIKGFKVFALDMTVCLIAANFMDIIDKLFVYPMNSVFKCHKASFSKVLLSKQQTVFLEYVIVFVSVYLISLKVR